MTPSIRLAGQLRSVLGRLNPGQRQQGHDAGWEMTHALITLALAALAWPFGWHDEVAAMVATFYRACSRTAESITASQRIERWGLRSIL